MHPKFFPQSAVGHMPRSLDVVEVFLAIKSVTEGHAHARPYSVRCPVVNGLAKELIVGEVVPLRASCPVPVEGELDRVEERGLPASVDAAEENDRAVLSAHRDRRQVESLLTSVEAEVPHG